MTAPDRWSESLHCDNCNTSGQADFSQAAAVSCFAGDQDITVERVSTGFRAVLCQYGSSFFCAACGSPAKQEAAYSEL